MNRQALGIIISGLLVIGGVAAYFATRPTPETSTVTAPAEPPPLPVAVLKDRPASEAPVATPGAARVTNASPSASGTGDTAAPGVGVVNAPPPVTAATTGTLRFESDVPGTQVFLDRVLVGVVPITANDVKPGPHRLNLSIPGYEPVVETIEVTPGPRDFVYTFKEVRLDVKLEVIHKHRLGSCKGTLIATQHGMRYETTDKDDAFKAALVDLETLQMDYLEKRLRIGIRGGKRFDFTDPDGNADRLFVFHRDVEKARDRLKKGDPPAPQL